MKKVFSKFVVGLFVVGTALPVFGSSVHADVNKNRIYGNDRIETSIKISQDGWKDGSGTVVIAQGYGYADALCAGPLAKKYNAPIILSKQDALSDDTISEIKRLKSNKVFVIGGTGALSENVVNQLKNIGVNNTERLGGADRYETSVKIAQSLGSVQSAVVVSGNGYADSLSISPVAAKEGMPILLSEKDNLPSVVEKYVKSISLTKTYVVGGIGVIGESIKNSLPNAQRLGGSNRFETNLAVLENFKSDFKFDNVYIAQGDGVVGDEFADALSGSALAAQKSAPIVLIYKNMTSELEKFIVSNASSSTVITALGGAAVVPDNVISNVISDYNNSNPSTNPTTPVTPTHSSSGGSSGGSGGGNITPSQQDSQLKQITKDNVTLTITETVSKNIVIKSTSKNASDSITITLYDKDGNLKYINQAIGAMNESTLLDVGEYHGNIKTSNADIINIDAFQVK